MMELSKRLQAVADLVTADCKLADIGTDHGYIPIALVERGKIPGAIAMDVNQGPLERAEEHIRAYQMEGQIETRLSNGFTSLKKGQVQSAVIAGMGGGLVIRILTDGKEIVSDLQECILQPQSEIHKVREFLNTQGYRIVEEDMVKEAVEEAKAKAAKEQAEAEETATEDAQEAEAEAKEATEEATETEGDSEAASEGKKKFFGKKEKKDKKDEKIEELTDRVTRQMAEFDNFRKRSEKEKSQMYEIGAKDIIEKILPVVDNFERGLDSVPEEEKNAPFVEGMEKIYKQLMTTLESVGVKPIEAVGQEFNPDFHNAVMHVEDEEFGENIIAEEFQKGYMYRESVVRHSMVKVAN